MIVRIGLLQKRPELSMREFDEYWMKQHADLARDLPGLRAYQQNHVVEAAQRGIDFTRGSKDYDGFSQLWFDDADSMTQAIDSLSNQLFTDEQEFIGDLDLLVTEPVTVIPTPDHASVKRMSTLRRRPELSVAEFVAAWSDHAELVRRMPGVAGYRQHVVIDRARDTDQGKSGAPTASYDDVPIDGVVEMWFGDVGDIESAFSSPEGQETMRHAATFLSEINTYIVDCIQIVHER